MLPDCGVDKLAFQQSRFANSLVGELVASEKINGVGIEGLGNHVNPGSSPEDMGIGIVVAGMVKTKHWRPQCAVR